jgi:hypothetical protein
MKTGWRKWLILGGLLAVGSIPLAWFRHGNFLASADTLLPQTWEDNLRLLHFWNTQIATGAIHLFDGAAVLFNMIPALVWKWTGSMWMAQVVTHLIWYMAAVWSMAGMVWLLYRGPLRWWAILTSATLYGLNHYLSAIWVGFYKPNIALYAVLPLFLGIWIRLLDGTLPVWPWLGLAALLTLPASTVGTKTPIVVVGISALGTAALWACVRAGRMKDKRLLYGVLGKTLLMCALLAGLHAFWVIPQLVLALGDPSTTPLATARQQALAWLEGLSRHTSFWNVIRFQGDWIWYTGHGEPYTLYAERILTQPIWIVLSWLIPAFVFIGLIQPRQPYRTVLMILLALGIFGSMGTHPPNGFLFRWLVLHLPGFWMFRSAWFHWMILTALGLSFFFGVGSAAWLSRRSPRHRPMWALGILLGVWLYAHPIWLGEIFPREDQRKNLPPFQFRVPSYVEETARWFRSQTDSFRLFVLPGREGWANRWGYGGFFPFLRYLIPQPLVYEFDPLYQMISQGADVPSIPMIRAIRQSLSPFQGDLTPRLDRLLNRLGVAWVLHESDFRYELLPLSDSPVAMEERLAEQVGLRRIRSFGPWTIWQVAGTARPRWFLTESVVATMGDLADGLAVSRSDEWDTSVYWEVHDEAVFRKLVESGLIRRVLITDNEWHERSDWKRLIASLPDEIPIGILLGFSPYDSKQVSSIAADSIPLDPHGIVWRWGAGMKTASLPFSDPETLWVEANDLPDVVIVNPYPEPVSVALRCEVRTLKKSRILYPMLHGTQPIHTDLKGTTTTVHVGEQPTPVFLPSLLLRPGENHLDFQTTEPWETVDGQLFSFGIRHLEIGDPRVRLTLWVPRRGIYRVTLHPQYRGAIWDREARVFPNGRSISIGGKSIPLTLQRDMVGLWRWQAQDVELEEGKTQVMVETCLGEGWVLELDPQDRIHDSVEPRAIQPVASNPSTHILEFSLTKPALLVFNESYHPRWTAERWPHLRVDGFANAWVVPEGSHRIEVTFSLSRNWAKPSRAVSIGVAWFLLITCGVKVGVVFLRKRNG